MLIRICTVNLSNFNRIEKIVGYYEFSNSGNFKNDPSPSFIGFFSTNSSYDRQGSEIENL